MSAWAEAMYAIKRLSKEEELDNRLQEVEPKMVFVSKETSGGTPETYPEGIGPGTLWFVLEEVSE